LKHRSAKKDKGGSVAIYKLGEHAPDIHDSVFVDETAAVILS
jgi:hypothetical protein